MVVEALFEYGLFSINMISPLVRLEKLFAANFRLCRPDYTLAFRAYLISVSKKLPCELIHRFMLFVMGFVTCSLYRFSLKKNLFVKIFSGSVQG